MFFALLATHCCAIPEIRSMITILDITVIP